MTITVYTKNDCQPCRATKRKLEQKGLAFVELNVDELPELRERLIARGFMASPVVDVEGPGVLDRSWAGYRPDLIDAVVEELA